MIVLTVAIAKGVSNPGLLDRHHIDRVDSEIGVDEEIADIVVIGVIGELQEESNGEHLVIPGKRRSRLNAFLDAFTFGHDTFDPDLQRSRVAT